MTDTEYNAKISQVRADFPILKRQVNNKDLVYLDNAATTLKPKSVVEVIERHYLMEASNIHRGVHFLSELGTQAYEETRVKVQKLINASSEEEVIFTTGTTGSINLVMNTFGREFLKEGDEILISAMEHHSNIVPWQMLCQQNGCVLKVIPMDANGDLDLVAFDNLLSEKTKFMSLVYISNSLGTINPVKELCAKAKAIGATVLIDAAQAIMHMPIDVQELNCDFLAFSGHKMFGPTGTGILYGRKKLLEAMPPFLGGGDMIKSVSFEETTYNDLPYKFEAGTPHIAGFIGLAPAVDYLLDLGWDFIARREKELLELATAELSSIPGLRIIGTAKKKACVISFVVDGVHPDDIAMMLNQDGIAIRTGHHCTQPVLRHFEVDAMARASFYIYNSNEDVKKLAESLRSALELLV